MEGSTRMSNEGKPPDDSAKPPGSARHTLYEFSGGRGKVWASYADEDGSLNIDSYDPGGMFDDGSDYEFIVTVRPEHFDLLREVLGADADADVLTLVADNGEVVGKATTAFMTNHSIPYEFSSWIGH
jgi:hypothetical protein